VNLPGDEMPFDTFVADRIERRLLRGVAKPDFCTNGNVISLRIKPVPSRSWSIGVGNGVSAFAPVTNTPTAPSWALAPVRGWTGETFEGVQDQDSISKPVLTRRSLR
jgi:hypothetical protein